MLLFWSEEETQLLSTNVKCFFLQPSADHWASLMAVCDSWSLLSLFDFNSTKSTLSMVWGSLTKQWFHQWLKRGKLSKSSLTSVNFGSLINAKQHQTVPSEKLSSVSRKIQNGGSYRSLLAACHHPVWLKLLCQSANWFTHHTHTAFNTLWTLIGPLATELMN